MAVGQHEHVQAPAGVLGDQRRDVGEATARRRAARGAEVDEDVALIAPVGQRRPVLEADQEAVAEAHLVHADPGAHRARGGGHGYQASAARRRPAWNSAKR